MPASESPTATAPFVVARVVRLPEPTSLEPVAPEESRAGILDPQVESEGLTIHVRPHERRFTVRLTQVAQKIKGQRFSHERLVDVAALEIEAADLGAAHERAHLLIVVESHLPVLLRIRPRMSDLGSGRRRRNTPYPRRRGRPSGTGPSEGFAPALGDATRARTAAEREAAKGPLSSKRRTNRAATSGCRGGDTSSCRCRRPRPRTKPSALRQTARVLPRTWTRANRRSIRWASDSHLGSTRPPTASPSTSGPFSADFPSATLSIACLCSRPSIDRTRVSASGSCVPAAVAVTVTRSFAVG